MAFFLFDRFRNVCFLWDVVSFSKTLFFPVFCCVFGKVAAGRRVFVKCGVFSFSLLLCASGSSEACVHVCRAMNLVNYQHSCFVLACVCVFVWCMTYRQPPVNRNNSCIHFLLLEIYGRCFTMTSSGSPARDQIQKSCLCLDLTDKVQTGGWS